MRSQFGQIDYSQDMDGLLEGQPYANAKGSAKQNPLAAMVITFTVGGTASAGVYTLSILDDFGRESVASFDRQGAETNDQIAAALRASINSNDPATTSGQWRNKATASGTGADVVITADARGLLYSVGQEVAPGSGTMSGAITTTASGTEIKFGRALVAVGADEVALPSSGTAAAEILFCSGRMLGNSFNQGSSAAADSDGYLPGSQFDAIHTGIVAVVNHGADVTAYGAQVHVVKDTAGGQDPGQFRGDADGGNTVALDVQRAIWIDTPANGEVGLIRFSL